MTPGGRTKIPSGAGRMLRIEKGSDGEGTGWTRGHFGTINTTQGKNWLPGFIPAMWMKASPFTRALIIAASDQAQDHDPQKCWKGHRESQRRHEGAL